MKDRENSTLTADQRRSDRRALEAPVAMRLETGVLAGLSDNISSAGLLFFTDEPLRVTIEVQEPDGPGATAVA